MIKPEEDRVWIYGSSNGRLVQAKKTFSKSSGRANDATCAVCALSDTLPAGAVKVVCRNDHGTRNLPIVHTSLSQLHICLEEA